MTRCGIEITSNDPGLLQFLVSYPANPSWSIIGVEGKYYLISPDFLKFADPQEVWQAADNLLFVINGILKFKFKSPGIVREGTIANFDENNQFIRGAGLRVLYNVSASLSASESYYRDADARQPSLADIWHKAQRSDVVEEALQHYSNEHNWFNLYKVFEIIRRDTYRLEDSRIIPRGSFDVWTKGRKVDFDESANRERHSSFIYSPNQKVKFVYMSLQEADEFISDLILQWLQSK